MRKLLLVLGLVAAVVGTFVWSQGTHLGPRIGRTKHFVGADINDCDFAGMLVWVHDFDTVNAEVFIERHDPNNQKRTELWLNVPYDDPADGRVPFTWHDRLEYDPDQYGCPAF
jgi:hypothetical protein